MSRVFLSGAARADIVAILAWTHDSFGPLAAERYRRLISLALKDSSAAPKRIGAVARPEIENGARIYHLRYSRRGAGVARPRHFILYKVDSTGDIMVGRILHEVMDLTSLATVEFSKNS